MLEQLVDEDQRNGPPALEAQPVATRPMAPKRPAPAGWELVMFNLMGATAMTGVGVQASVAQFIRKPKVCHKVA